MWDSPSAKACKSSFKARVNQTSSNFNKIWGCSTLLQHTVWPPTFPLEMSFSSQTQPPGSLWNSPPFCISSHVSRPTPKEALPMKNRIIYFCIRSLVLITLRVTWLWRPQKAQGRQEEKDGRNILASPTSVMMGERGIFYSKEGLKYFQPSTNNEAQYRDTLCTDQVSTLVSLRVYKADTH